MCKVNLQFHGNWLNVITNYINVFNLAYYISKEIQMFSLNKFYSWQIDLNYFAFNIFEINPTRYQTYFFQDYFIFKYLFISPDIPLCLPMWRMISFIYLVLRCVWWIFFYYMIEMLINYKLGVNIEYISHRGWIVLWPGKMTPVDLYIFPLLLLET